MSSVETSQDYLHLSDDDIFFDRLRTDGQFFMDTLRSDEMSMADVLSHQASRLLSNSNVITHVDGTAAIVTPQSWQLPQEYGGYYARLGRPLPSKGETPNLPMVIVSSSPAFLDIKTPNGKFSTLFFCVEGGTTYLMDGPDYYTRNYKANAPGTVAIVGRLIHEIEVQSEKAIQTESSNGESLLDRIQQRVAYNRDHRAIESAVPDQGYHWGSVAVSKAEYDSLVAQNSAANAARAAAEISSKIQEQLHPTLTSSRNIQRRIDAQVALNRKHVR